MGCNFSNGKVGKKWYVFCFLLRYYTSSVFVIFWSQSTFLAKTGTTKTKGGKANVLNNSKILRRSFFQNIIMHYYCGTNTNFVCGESKWWVNSTSVKDLPHIQTLMLYIYSGTATITQMYHRKGMRSISDISNWIE